eukprot:494599_1
MVQYVPNPYKLECTRKGTMTSMTEDHKKIVKNILKDCIRLCIDDDEKTEITTSLIRDKLKEDGMKAIVITAGRISTTYGYYDGADTMEHATWDLGKFGIYDIIMVQYVQNTYKLECIGKGDMTEDQRNVIKNVFKDCINDGKAKINTSLIRDKLNENGMKAIAITAGRVSCYFSMQKGAQKQQYSTWDLGKFGVYDIIMVQYVPNPYKLECTRKGTMTEDHKKVVKNVLKCCIDDHEKTEITTALIREKLKQNGMKSIVMTAG